ncbi:hypothetical protein [Geodermatophilus siccatus]|uniref:hypothetical protein n=1 Tax=Geodermatophilus siccatus TaxID=1137991 RepID=UPI001113395D|nr:hypothetical protein [Geodermatophilus siccatus]
MDDGMQAGTLSAAAALLCHVGARLVPAPPRHRPGVVDRQVQVVRVAGARSVVGCEIEQVGSGLLVHGLVMRSE